MTTQLPDLPGDTLAVVEGALRSKRGAEARILRAAAHWADQHPGDSIGRFGHTSRGGERAITIGGEGTPSVAEFCHAELAVSLEVHPLSARSLMADALDLRHRLPSVWAFVTVDLSMPEWVARKIARATRELSGRQVAEIDRRLAGIATTLPPSRLLTVVDAMVLSAKDEESDEERKRRLSGRFVNVSDGRKPNGSAELPVIYGRLDEADGVRLEAMIARLAKVLAEEGDDDPVDVRRSKALGLLANPELALDTLRGGRNGDRLAPPVTLYLHVTDQSFTCGEGGVARFEQGGPITLAQAREILGHSRVTIRPVLDPEDQRPADAYEFTGDLREAVLARTPADVYPYAVRVGRSTEFEMDVDHTRAYDADGPPDQTRPENGGPTTRHHHRIKTHGPMSLRQPRPNVYVWRTSHGRYLVSDLDGTRRIARDLGDGVFYGSDFEQRFATMLITAPETRG